MIGTVSTMPPLLPVSIKDGLQFASGEHVRQHVKTSHKKRIGHILYKDNISTICTQLGISIVTLNILTQNNECFGYYELVVEYSRCGVRYTIQGYVLVNILPQQNIDFVYFYIRSDIQSKLTWSSNGQVTSECCSLLAP